MKTLTATLLAEPFNLSLEQVVKLTPWQIRNLYFHPRTDKGQIVQEPEAAAESPEEQYRQVLRIRGLPEHLIEKRIQEWKSARP